MAATSTKPPRKAKADAPPRITEADVQRQCVQAAFIVGVKLERRNTGAASYANADGSTRHVAYGTPGDGDLCGVLPDGRAISVEIKRPGKVPTEKQWERIEAMNNSNAVGLWTNDSAWLVKVLRYVLAGASVSFPGRTDECVITPRRTTP